MTLLAPSPAAGVGTTIPAVASLALRPLLAGPSLKAEVLGATRSAAWLRIGGDCMVVGGRSAVRLPNGLGTPLESCEDLVHHRVIVGIGRVLVGDAELRPVRWWNPRPRLGPVEPSRLASALQDDSECQAAELETGLQRRRAGEVLEAARDLLGLGPGLTPEGDDVLAGALAAFRLLGEAIGDPTAAATLEECRPALLGLARRRTTTLSASLVGHALEGRVAAPAAAFLAALAGRGDAARTRAEVARIGHSSGPALVAGILAGARAVARGAA